MIGSQGCDLFTNCTIFSSKSHHYDFNTDKVCNSLRIQVLVDTCAMSTWITEGQWTTLCWSQTCFDRTSWMHSWPKIMRSRNSWLQSWSSRRRRNLASLHCQRRKQRSVIDRFVWRLECREWNRRICDPREIRNRTVPDCKRKKKGHQC